MNCNKETLLVIYKATNLINGKIYIGKTCKGLNNRIRTHKADFNSFKRDGKLTYPFYRAIEKYGFENFSWEVIDTANSIEELDKKEIYWINTLRSLVQYNKGYNVNPGGNGGDNWTNNPRKEEIREKFKHRRRPVYTEELLRKRKESFAKTIQERTPERRSEIGKRVRESLKLFHENNKGIWLGRPVSDEAKIKISKSLKGRFSGKNNPNYGNNWSKEKKENLSNYFRNFRSYKGNLNPNCKKCRYYNLKTNCIEEYNSRKEFCEKYNFKYDTVEQNSKLNKIIGKNFVSLPDGIVDIETFVEEIKSKSRWFKKIL